MTKTTLKKVLNAHWEVVSNEITLESVLKLVDDIHALSKDMDHNEKVKIIRIFLNPLINELKTPEEVTQVQSKVLNLGLLYV